MAADAPSPSPNTAFEELVPNWLAQASLGAAILTVPSVILDVTEGLPPWLATFASVLNWCVWSVFLITFVVALHNADDRWAALKANPVLPIVVLLTTPIAPAGLQMFRLLRLGALIGAAHHAQKVFSIEGLRYAALILCVVVVGGGAIFSAVEHSAQDLSIEDGIWWAIVTVTTVGYGDIVPHTEAGRGVAVIVMLTGIGTAALLVGAASQRFVAGSDEADGDGDGEPDGERVSPSLAELHRDLTQLRGEIAALREELRPPGAPGS